MKTQQAWAISDEARHVLKRCELFQDLDTDRMMEVAALVEEYSLEPDDILLEEGNSAEHLFVIVKGRAVAQLEMYRGWLSLGLVGPGDASGWSALIGAQVYPASVKALTPMQIARVDAKGLNLLMTLEPKIGYPIHKRLSSVFCRQYQAALESFKTSG